METEESGLCGGVLNKSQCVDFFCPPGRQKVAVVDQRGGHYREVWVYYINYYIIRLEDWELCIVKLNDLVSDDEISPLL